MKDDQKETKLKGQIELQGLAEREREQLQRELLL